MPDLVAIVAADTHLEPGIWSTRPEISGDAFYGFQQCVDQAIKENVPLIVAGDFLENLPVNNPTSRTIRFVREQLQRLRSNGVEFGFINGQHDITRSYNDNWANAIGFGNSYVDGRVLSVGGLRLAFLSHRVAAAFPDAIGDLPEADVLICHQVIQELKGGFGVEVSLNDYDYDVVISGDYHKTLAKDFVTASGKPGRAYSPGATHKRKSIEPSHHHVALLYADRSVKFRRINSRIAFKAEIHDEDSYALLVEQCEAMAAKAAVAAKEKELPPNLRTPFFYLVDHSTVIGVENRFKELLQTRAHLLYKRVVSKSSPAYSEALRVVSTEAAIAAAVEIECGENTMLCNDLKIILDSRDPVATLRRLVAERCP